MIFQWRELDFLEEKRCDSQLWVAASQRRTAQYFNSKVKARRLQVRDLVLRRVLHNKETLDWSWKGPYKIVGVLTANAEEKDVC